MTDALFHAYTSLFGWIGVGLLLSRLLPETIPHWLGRGLFWIGMPIEIFALARHTDFSHVVLLTPVATLSILTLGLSLAFGFLQINQRWPLGWLGLRGQSTLSLYPNPAWSGWSATIPGDDGTHPKGLSEAQKGSFVLSAMLGNTGFVGLAIAATLLSPENLGIAAFFAVLHNVFGLYGVGVFVSHHFGQSEAMAGWQTSLWAILKVPSLWAFGLGVATQSIFLPASTEAGLDQCVWIVIPCAFVLTGMRLCQIRNWHTLVSGVLPATVKVLMMPAIVALLTPYLGIVGEPRLALVLMAGTPTALTTLVLAEEYNLDRDVMASSIALSMVALIPLVPLWIAIVA
ncbi:MAG: AEC family transporter [Thermosynechococcaceae cyanobacterium]